MALTIAAALIWKDAISDALQLLVPAADRLTYKFGTAIIATIIITVLIYLVLETDHEAEYAYHVLFDRRGSIRRK